MALKKPIKLHDHKCHWVSRVNRLQAIQDEIMIKIDELESKIAAKCPEETSLLIELRTALFEKEVELHQLISKIKGEEYDSTSDFF